jgi:uncharacterized small protein (DUF1192 family)
MTEDESLGLDDAKRALELLTNAIDPDVHRHEGVYWSPHEMRWLADRLAWCVAEIERLQAGIRHHRDQKGDDRCWLDDLDLYDLLPEGHVDPDLSLPPKAEFLRSCERYWEQRCPFNKAGHITRPGLTIAQLEAEIERLRAERGMPGEEGRA